jgi:hypothetical protein
MTSTLEPASALRPLSLVELLDRAIRLYRQNFLKFVAIIAVVQLPLTLISMFLSAFMMSPALVRMQQYTRQPTRVDPSSLFGVGYWTAICGSLAVAVLQFFLIQGVANAAMTRAVADNYLGEKTGFVEAYRKIGPRLGAVLSVLLVYIALTIGLWLWWLVPCAGWLTGLGALIFVGAVVFPLTMPVVVLEGKGYYAALRRAWDLARRRFWNTVAYVAVLVAFSLLLILGPTYLFAFIFQMVAGNPLVQGDVNLYALQVVMQSLISLAFSLVYTPLYLVAMTLLYFDLRVRTEGFDLAWLASGAACQPGGAAAVAAAAPPTETSGVVTMQEMGYFALATIGLAVVYAALVTLTMGLSLLLR